MVTKDFSVVVGDGDFYFVVAKYFSVAINVGDRDFRVIIIAEVAEGFHIIVAEYFSVVVTNSADVATNVSDRDFHVTVNNIADVDIGDFYILY